MAAIASVPASAGQTFDAVKAQGFVQCAVNTGLACFSFSDSQGKLDVGLRRRSLPGDCRRDVRRCREGGKYTPTTSWQQRFVALQSGEVDVITRNAT